jgi:hypothetical protein
MQYFEETGRVHGRKKGCMCSCIYFGSPNTEVVDDDECVDDHVRQYRTVSGTRSVMLSGEFINTLRSADLNENYGRCGDACFTIG